MAGTFPLTGQRGRPEVERQKRLTLKDQRGIGANQDGARACTTDGAGTAFCVDSDVAGEDDGVAAVPAAALDPVDGIEGGVGGAVARVLGVEALDVVVAGGGEEVHEDGLDRLGLVDDGLSADIEATDGFGVDVVALQEGGDDCGGDETRDEESG